MKRACCALLLSMAAAASGQTLSLGMKDAVDLALEPDGAVRLELAREAIRQAEGRKGQARAALLPQVDSQLSYDSRTVNLDVFGLGSAFSTAPFPIPSRAGPFTVFDARGSAAQSIFDWSAIRRYQAAGAGVSAARAERDAASDHVAAQVAKAYLAALRAGARVETAEANVKLGEELLSLAQRQRDAGTGTGIDVTRARVQLQNERQQLLVARNERTRSHLELLRAMDLKLETSLDLTGRMELQPVATPEIGEAVETALASRHDWKARQAREKAARLSYSAGKSERLPSLSAFGNYGTLGRGLDNNFPTRTYGIAVQVPIFDGGRMDARRGESASQLRDQEIQTADLRSQVELELRLAMNDLRSAAEQAEVAGQGLELAENELAQARRRFQAGVANSIEVTGAQTRLSRARDNRIAAVFAHESARLDLAEALGKIEEWIQ